METHELINAGFTELRFLIETYLDENEAELSATEQNQEAVGEVLEGLEKLSGGLSRLDV